MLKNRNCVVLLLPTRKRVFGISNSLNFRNDPVVSLLVNSFLLRMCISLFFSYIKLSLVFARGKKNTAFGFVIIQADWVRPSISRFRFGGAKLNGLLRSLLIVSSLFFCRAFLGSSVIHSHSMNHLLSGSRSDTRDRKSRRK
jgi:hypothetical protein